VVRGALAAGPGSLRFNIESGVACDDAVVRLPCAFHAQPLIMNSSPRLLGIALVAASSLFADHPKSAEDVPLSDQLGLQLWSLKDQFEKDVIGTLDVVGSYGLPYVETAGTNGMVPEQYRLELLNRGVEVVSAHVQYNELVNNFEAVLLDVIALGAKHAMIPWIPHDGAFTEDDNAQAIERLKEWGPKFAAQGIKLGYHPHGYEFGAGKEEVTLFDKMAAATAGHDVYFQMDVCWVVYGGEDPIALLHEYKDRWVSMHVKDIRQGVPVGFLRPDLPAEDRVVVGTGQVDWPAVISTARSYGMELFFIEDEGVNSPRDIPLSLAYLRGLDI
jgi:sugar phosphate isomerase/epimerase